MNRCGSSIRLRPGKIDESKRLHAAAWPAVLAMIADCNIRNYTIFLRSLPDGNLYLFSYFEHVGTDFAADMAKMAAAPTTREWWSHTDTLPPRSQRIPGNVERDT